MTSTIYCAIGTPGVGEEEKTKAQPGAIRQAIEKEIHVAEDHANWHCAAVIPGYPRRWNSRSLPELILYSWDKKEYKYKVVESLTLPDEVNELDHYIFVVRTRIGEYPSFYLILYS